MSCEDAPVYTPSSEGTDVELDEETLVRVVVLKDQYSKYMGTDECWLRIAEELNISPEQSKQHFAKTITRHRECKDDPIYVNSNLCQLLTSLEVDMDFLYCLENFSDLCRFCCRLRSDSTEVIEIFDDSSEEQLHKSHQLIEKINFALYDNILEKVDLKLSKICKSCAQRIEEFYEFKKLCDRNTEIFMQVKTTLDKMRCKAEQNEDDQIDETDFAEGESSQASDEESLTDDVDEVDEEITDEQQDILAEKSLKKKLKSSDVSKKERNRKSYKGKNSQCTVCGKLVKGLQMHMLTHTGEKRHKCSYCSKSFTQSGQLKRHINSHLNIRNYKCPETGCDRTFVDPSSVTKHMVVHNKEDRKYQCSLCGSRFNRLGALRYHEKTHRQERNHTCDICKKSFLAKYDLTKHFRTHTGEKPYSCRFCDKKFSISKNAKVHLRVHTKEKPYSCSLCDLSFAYRSSMKNHLIKIHNHADLSNLPIVNTTSRTDSDQHDMDQLQQITENAIENISSWHPTTIT